jgi:flagellar biogenesis protein FliO
MWLILTILVVIIGLAWLYRRISTHTRKRSGNSDVYVCPNCGNRHCDCYKNTK